MTAAPGTAPVSVVIPYYRSAPTIERAVHSVLDQTRAPAEIIVVDDGSPAEARRALDDVVSRCAGRGIVRIVRLATNQGPAAARNAGWRAATQRYVAFLDADDSWLPEKIERQVRVFARQDSLALVGHAAMVTRTSSDGPRPVAAVPAEPVVKRIHPRQLLLRNHFPTSSVMVRRDIPLRFPDAGRYAEDYELWLRIVLGGHAAAMFPETLAVYYKGFFGEGGLSARMWRMECGELGVYRTLWTEGRISFRWLVVSASFSWARFTRRLLIVCFRRARRLRTAHGRRADG